MQVIDCGEIDGILIPKPFERLVKVIVDPNERDDVKDVSVTMGIIAPHSQNDLHNHPGVEILYIATGYGKAIIGDETYELKANHLIVAPVGVMHCQINESDETMRMLAIWTPAVDGKEVIKRAVEAARV